MVIVKGLSLREDDVILAIQVRNLSVKDVLDPSKIHGKQSVEKNEEDGDQLHDVSSCLLFLTCVSEVLPDDLVRFENWLYLQRSVEQHQLLNQLPLRWQCLRKESQCARILLEHIFYDILCFTVLENDEDVLHHMHPLSLWDSRNRQVHILFDSSLLDQKLVSLLKAFFLLHEYLEFVLLVGDLVLLVLIGVELQIDFVHSELDLLHTEDKLNARLSVVAQSDVDDFKVVVLVGFLTGDFFKAEDLRKVQPHFHLDQSRILSVPIEDDLVDLDTKVLHLDP